MPFSFHVGPHTSRENAEVNASAKNKGADHPPHPVAQPDQHLFYKILFLVSIALISFCS